MSATKKRKAAGKPKAKAKRRSATKVMKATRRISRATRQVKETAMKALVGAAAGAVRAIIPPLEKAVGGQREAAGRKR
jgi:hypothetical protein